MEQEKVSPETTDESQLETEKQTAEDQTMDEAAADAEASSVETAGDSPDDVTPEKLQLMLEDARAKADEHWEMVIRARAESENLKKRHARELENAHKYAIEKFVNEILPVRDSMELGLSAGKEEGADVEKILEGTELTLKLLTDVMAKFGIEQVDPQGQPFNPELHQAMAMQPSDEVEPNTVLTVVQKGYTLNGRLVRPAMVMVSQAT